MTILSAQSIAIRHGMIVPFVNKTIFNGKSYGLTGSGYDVRIKEPIVIGSGEFRLASIIEYLDIPDDITAQVMDKSSWARTGLSLLNTVIEPGWRGFLTIEMMNHSKDTIVIGAGTPIAQIQFHKLDRPTVLPYAGKYQDQPDRPVGAIHEVSIVPFMGCL